MNPASHPDTSVTKVTSSHSPRGPHGEIYLASGIRTSMRLWKQEAPGASDETTRPYETVGYVVEGRAELHIEGQLVVLEPGDSWVVNAGVKHKYVVKEPFTAIEATSPPAHVHGRDA